MLNTIRGTVSQKRLVKEKSQVPVTWQSNIVLLYEEMFGFNLSTPPSRRSYPTLMVKSIDRIRSGVFICGEKG